ncbi:hypothetical protein D3C73_1658330 [compost metagenome]
MLPVEKALTTVSGMMFVRKPTMVLSCAAWAYCDTAPASRLAGSMFRPRPGWTRLATIRSTIKARVEKTRK